MRRDGKHDWTHEIRKGDILRSGTGALRIVRKVQHGIRTTVIFSIRRCSWTTRCYTVYGESDLRTMRYSPTGKRATLRKSIDREIESAIGKIEIELTCCDVEGIG